MNRFIHLYIVGSVLLFVVYACTPDRPQAETKQLSEEALYLEDYEIPAQKWGYLDTSGRLVIPSIYDHARDFSEGLAAVNSNGKWGYINKEGSIAIKPAFRSAYEFKDGVARVQEMNKKYGFINQKGEFLIDPIHDEVYDFSNGLARLKSGIEYVYIHRSGDTVIHNGFTIAGNFKSGFAKVFKGAFGLIDTTGHFIVPVKYDQVYFPRESKIRIKQKDKYGFLNIDGSMAIPPGFDSATDFYDGKSFVSKDEMSFFINRSGKTILETDFEDALYIGGGNWSVKNQSGKWAILNDLNELSSRFKYDFINKFSGVNASYLIDGNWGFININGEEITSAVYPLVWDFKENKARVITRGGVGYIGLNGEMLIEPYYFENRDFSEGLARVQTF